MFFLMAVLSGFMIGIGGTASLLAQFLFGNWGKLVGAVLFSLGIYAIVTYGMKLFTGMVADIPKLGLGGLWQLPLCFFGNILGVALVAALVWNSPLAASVVPMGKAIVWGKLAMKGWGIKCFCSAILCGWLITLSVWASKYAPKKNLSASIEVIFPVVVFAFCGFDHSVANMLYFYFAGLLTWQVLGYVLVSIAGNIIGGVLLPLVIVLKERAKAERAALDAAQAENQ
ncbi:MAG: formate/nitrite transporter family protein [Clostridia bacterium]|nr:formate/nitrite transporter family protein [Clostridia bacterium]MBQ3063562.1 formate/nitrite transporter family protein [Clostridia bacterium]